MPADRGSKTQRPGYGHAIHPVLRQRRKRQQPERRGAVTEACERSAAAEMRPLKKIRLPQHSVRAGANSVFSILHSGNWYRAHEHVLRATMGIFRAAGFSSSIKSLPTSDGHRRADLHVVGAHLMGKDDLISVSNKGHFDRSALN